MGWFFTLLSAIAAFLLYKTGHYILMAAAIVAAAGIYWSWGIMRSYVSQLAKRKNKKAGGTYNTDDWKAVGAPDWVAAANMFLSMAASILLAAGIFFWFWG